jgi:hypothetical protein
MTAKTKKTGAAAALDKIATMPAAEADKLIERLQRDAMASMMALDAALMVRRKAAA